MMRGFLKTWYTLLDILFPPICLSCRSNIISREEKENLLCSACFNGIKIYSNIFRPVRDRPTNPVRKEINGTGAAVTTTSGRSVSNGVQPHPRFHLIAIGSYENTALRELLHYFKYNGFLAAKIPLEKLITRWLANNPNLASSILDSRFLIIPIPLHKKRLRNRGFNQAEIIGEILSRRLNLPLESLLERIRDTKSQIKMGTSKEREENMKNSIRIKEGKESSLPQYQSVILVDDIYTSGSTMREAVKALRRAGVKYITAFVIAKT